MKTSQCFFLGELESSRAKQWMRCLLILILGRYLHCSDANTLEVQYMVYRDTNHTLQFQQTTLFNGQVVFTCSSQTLRDQPRQEWVTHTFTQEQLQQRHMECRGQYEEHMSWYAKIQETTSRTAEVLQRRRGCMTNSSGVSAFDEWGVNGEDFLTFDPQTMKWTALSNMATTVAAEWNKLDIRNGVYSTFGQSVCPEMQGSFKSKRRELILAAQSDMQLQIFAKAIPGSTFSYLECQVTASDLSGVRIQLTKDGVLLHSEVKLIGPRPNGDQTNQMRVWVLITLESTRTYGCEAHSKAANEIVKSVLFDDPSLHKRGRYGLYSAFFLVCCGGFGIFIYKVSSSKSRKREGLVHRRREQRVAHL